MIEICLNPDNQVSIASHTQTDFKNDIPYTGIYVYSKIFHLINLLEPDFLPCFGIFFKKSPFKTFRNYLI